jgi:hypothetical protein
MVGVEEALAELRRLLPNQDGCVNQFNTTLKVKHSKAEINICNVVLIPGTLAGFWTQWGLEEVLAELQRLLPNLEGHMNSIQTNLGN